MKAKSPRDRTAENKAAGGGRAAGRKSVQSTREARPTVAALWVRSTADGLWARRGELLRSTLGQAMIGAGLFYAALPPLDLWVLGWIAPLAWLLLVRRSQLPGRRPYRALWLAGFLFWLGAVHWLRLPYWATAFGWVALAAYLAFYLPLFVGLSRVAVHRLRVPLIVAAPVVYAGLELVRGHALTGFNMGALAHTQYRWLTLIQISDLGGEYLVSAMMIFVTACVARMIPIEGQRRTAWPLAPLGAVLAATLLYGESRLAHDKPQPQARIALIQGSIDIEMHAPPGRTERIYRQYTELTDEAVRRFGPLDLIVWPETMFPGRWGTYDPEPQVPESWEGTPERFREVLADYARQSAVDLAEMARRYQTAMLLGVDREHYTAEGMNRLNAAVHVAATGEVLGSYHKRHLVLFGEYIPFTDWLPALKAFGPVNRLNLTLDAGQRAESFPVGPLRIAPNICYESVLPHVIRAQVNELAARGEPPDVLVNLTNDGWFWGSSELDMHLVCAVFRAVECRKPFLISANTGIAAWIDGDGRIQGRGPKRDTDIVLADVGRDARRSPYLAYGDWPAGLCLACCGILALVGLWPRKSAITPGTPPAPAKP